MEKLILPHYNIIEVVEQNIFIKTGIRATETPLGNGRTKDDIIDLISNTQLGKMHKTWHAINSTMITSFSDIIKEVIDGASTIETLLNRIWIRLKEMVIATVRTSC